VLRKFFNYNSSHKDRFEILKKYFVSHHYKSDKEKAQRKNLFCEINKHNDLKSFLEVTSPILTIPPYEDMNNRDTYKCNSMLINPELITDEIKEAIDFLLSKPDFEVLKRDENGELKKEELIKTKVITNNEKITTDFTYSKYLQRILDATEDITSKELNPRNVFKHQARFERGTIDSVECFKKVFTVKVYNSLKDIAKRYYKEEEKILNGIYEETTSIFVKCNTNTPYKNNAKHILLKPVYSYNFIKNEKIDEAEEFLNAIKNTYGLQKALERVSDEAKKYQNSFYHIIEACYNDEKCVDDKDIKTIVKDLKNITEKSIFFKLKTILQDKNTYLNTIEKVDSKNLKRVINIFKQTYEILFKELGGFNKTCKCCTMENSIRSDEKNVIAKRLLSDVAKPIDGMLDMMLDRLAYEITQNIEENDIKDISDLEILLEQNKFEFEESLISIKKANNKDIKPKKREIKDKLNITICPYSGKSFDKGDYDHILPQSKGVYNSKANMIYSSVEGNQKIKGAKDYTLEMIDKKHLKAMFKTEDITDIKKIILDGLSTIDIDNFTNFNNLKLKEQVAVRYGLFCKDDKDIFDKAFEIVKKDKIKTFSNGTQKRLARFIYEKLVKKFPTSFKDIEISSKTIDNQLVSSTRKFLAVNQETGEINHLLKEDKQNSHSHCIDAMVVFYLANSKAQKINRFEKSEYKQEKINKREFYFDFDDIYVDESGINNLSKNRTFINSPKNELGSYKLFGDTIYSEHYRHIKKDSLKKVELELLIKYLLLYINHKNKKIFIDNIEKIEVNSIYKLDIDKNKSELAKFKFLDKLQYFTSRKEIQSIFFDDKATKLLPFDTIKDIPYFSKNLYKAVYKKLQNEEKLFNIGEDSKSTLNQKVLDDLLKDMFSSKQKDEHKEQRKRGKKRHKFTLPVLGSPKFRIKRGNTWQVLGNKDIATKNYIIDGNIKPIPFFTKNTIPLKVSDLLECLLIDKDSQSIYEVDIDIAKISQYISKLKYIVTEAKRCKVIVTFVKKSFSKVKFNEMSTYNCPKDIFFGKFVNENIEIDNDYARYINSMRNNKLDKKNNGKDKDLKATAILIDNNNETITLEYMADINSDKKQIILDNLKD
jgi:hypothetical protein